MKGFSSIYIPYGDPHRAAFITYYPLKAHTYSIYPRCLGLGLEQSLAEQGDPGLIQARSFALLL